MKPITNILFRTVFYLVIILTLYNCSGDDDSSQPSINQAPESFTLTTVANTSTNVAVMPTFSWQAAIDPEGDAVTYSLVLDTNTEPTTIVQAGITATSYNLTERLSLYQTYYWQVIATDALGASTRSSVFNFTTRGIDFNTAAITNAAAFSERASHTSVVFDDKLWVIGGYDGARTNDVWSSLNGSTWTPTTNIAEFSARTDHTSIVFNDKLWVIGGFDDAEYRKNDVWHSTDGTTWVEATNSAGFSARRYHTSVVFDDKLWVIGGNDGTRKNDVWHSTDGTTWIAATTNAGFSARQYHTSVVFDDKIWVIGGDDNSIKNDVWYSTDGLNWIEATADASFSPRRNHSSVVFDNKLWVIGGAVAGQIKNDVWYSTDGVTWIEAVQNAAFSKRDFHSSLVFNNQMWVIGGIDEDFMLKNDVWAFE